MSKREKREGGRESVCEREKDKERDRDRDPVLNPNNFSTTAATLSQHEL